MSWPQNVDRSQCRIDFYRGTGAGGQKRNKTSSACRITHTPTGHVASCENHRSQPKNRAEAFRRLCKVLVPIMQKAAKVDFGETRSDTTVRTYHYPRNEVKDHRTGETYPLREVMDGKLEKVHTDLAGRGV